MLLPFLVLIHTAIVAAATHTAVGTGAIERITSRGMCRCGSLKVCRGCRGQLIVVLRLCGFVI